MHGQPWKKTPQFLIVYIKMEKQHRNLAMKVVLD
jgi:hypothetical protein